MYKGLVFILLIMTFSCSGDRRENIEIFNAACDTCSTFSVDGKGVFRDGILWMENPADTTAGPVLNIADNWDFSVYNQLKIELVNGSETENIDVLLTIEAGDPSSAGLLTNRHLVYGGQRSTWIVNVPPALPYPGLNDSFPGMRATPYAISGVSSTLNPEKARKLSVSFGKAVPGIKLGIHRITASKVPTAELPEWTQLRGDRLFPVIDEYGQFIHKEWPGKTRSDKDLIAARELECAELRKYSGDSSRCGYGGYKKGPEQKATGAFYVKKVNGKWWMVDPDGHLFWAHGVVRVIPSSGLTPLDDRKYLFSSLPDPQSSFGEFYTTRDESLYPYYVSRGIKETFDFSASNLKKKYGNDWRKKFNDLLHERLASWGMNTICASSGKSIYLKNLTPYWDRLDPQSPPIEGAPVGLAVIRDPYHPDFAKSLRDLLAERKEELNSSWCIGYGVDNKFFWGNETDLANWVLKSSDSQPAKIAFRGILNQKYHSIDTLNSAWGTGYRSWTDFLTERSIAPAGATKDLRYFTDRLTERYFAEIKRVLDEAAPGKLYLGCRFNTFNERVLNIVSKYADVLTFDLFVDSLAGFRLPEGIDKPVLIGEFHFGALDRGLFNAGLNEKRSQIERGNAYFDYVSSALNHPFIIGTSWHQFSDQATSGRFDGENFQDGLTDICDQPYKETISKVREIGYRMYEWRLK